MKEEIFGPILTVYVYKENEYEKIVDLVDTTTPFALTGSIFCGDTKVLAETREKLRNSCGNMYINDKSTGAGKRETHFSKRHLAKNTQQMNAFETKIQT